MLVFRLFFVAVSFLFVSNCTSIPVEEAKAFKSAVLAMQSAGDVLIDDLAVAERKQWLSTNDRGPFYYSESGTYFYSSLREPPSAFKLRAALKIIADYADLEQSLVEGRGVAESRAKIQEIATAVSAIAQAPGIAVAVGALSPIIDRLLLASSVWEARSIVAEGATAIKDMTRSLRSAAPAIFTMIVWNVRTRNVSEIPKARQKAVLYRQAVSDFIVLLDRIDETFDLLQYAYARPSDAVSLANLAKSTGALSADVKAFRQTWTTLRTL